MIRFFVVVVIGAVAMMVWNAVAWIALPHHTMTIETLPDEGGVRELLTGVDSGTYFVPGWGEGTEAEMDAFAERHEAGPIATIHLQKEGAPVMSPVVHIRGFGLMLGASIFAMAILFQISKSPGGRPMVALCGIFLGFFVAFGTHLPYWNYMYQPIPSVLAGALDGVVSGAILGLVGAIGFAPPRKDRSKS